MPYKGRRSSVHATSQKPPGTEANTLWLPLEWILVTLALTYHPTTVSVSVRRYMDVLWFNQQWGEGRGEPGGTDMAAWLHFPLR